jgi:hypothetical protein
MGKFLTAVGFLCFAVGALAQSDMPTCKDLHQLQFYCYPKNSTDVYYCKRQGDIEVDYNMTKKDSAIWKVEWKNECVYGLKYVSGNAKLDAQTLDLLNKHKLVYKVDAITKDYFLYSTYVDKVNKVMIGADTAWFRAKESVASTLIFDQLKNEVQLKRAHFSDTSKYAVLYLYRPGKTLLMLADYLVYADATLMCLMKNKTGYIFKIYKEGPLKITARLQTDETSIPVDIKFGQRYYVKSLINWGIHKKLSNYKLEFMPMPDNSGKEEFAEVNY